jgi:hypothetical protein
MSSLEVGFDGGGEAMGVWRLRINTGKLRRGPLFGASANHDTALNMQYSNLCPHAFIVARLDALHHISYIQTCSLAPPSLGNQELQRSGYSHTVNNVHLFLVSVPWGASVALDRSRNQDYGTERTVLEAQHKHSH